VDKCYHQALHSLTENWGQNNNLRMKTYLIKPDIFYPIYKHYLEMRVFYKRKGDMIEVKPVSKATERLVKELFDIKD